MPVASESRRRIKRGTVGGFVLAAALSAGCSRPTPTEAVLAPTASVPQGVLIVRGLADFEGGAARGEEVPRGEQRLVLHNRGTAPLYWIPQTDAAWLRFTPTLGQLDPGQSLDLLVEVDARMGTELESGHHKVDVALLDRSRRRAAARFSAHVWCGVNLDQGSWLRNGARKFLPVFVWNEEPTATWIDYFAGLGMNTWVGHAGEDTPEKALALLNLCREKNLYAVVTPHESVADHSALLAFQIGSGFDGLVGPLEELREERELARSLDAGLPVLALSPRSLQEKDQIERPDWVELLGLGFGKSDPTPSGTSTARGLPPRPYWALIQVDERSSAELHSVEVRLRHAVWSALVRGCTAVGYGLRSLPGSTHPSLSGEAEVALASLHAELAELTDLLLAPAPELSVEVEGEGAESISWGARQTEHGTALIVVNEGQEREVRATFRFDSPPTAVEAWQGASSPALVENGFEDVFDPLDCRLYILRP